MAGITGGGLLNGGLLGAQARRQYAAVAAMRWRIFVNGLRSIHGILDLGATGVAWTIYAMIGLGAGLGLGAGAYAIAEQAQWRHLPILFWIAGVLWLAFPMISASYQDHSDHGILLRFPVRLDSYFMLYVISGLMDASTIIGTICCFGIWLGVILVRPQMAVPLALVLAIFAAFNILLVLTVFAWLDRWLAQRRSREILGAVFMVLILSVQLFNPALYRHRDHGLLNPVQQREQAREARARYAPMLKTADQVQQWLPAGSAARAVQRAAEDRLVPATAWLGLLVIWTLSAAGALVLRLRAEYRGENLGWAPARALAAGPERAWTLGGSGACMAVLEKEVHSLRRTVPLLWALGAPLLLVLVVAGVFHPSASGHSFTYGLPLCVAYALLGFTQLFYNNLGAEGAGIQLLFLSPTPIRTVLLAKNLLHGVLFIVVACVAVALGCLRLGVPSAVVVAVLAAWLLFALPCYLAAGNILSLTMPYRINPGRIGRQPGSQANALTAMLIQAGTLGIGAAVLSICWSLERPWWAVPILLLLAVAAYFFWKQVLSNVDAMALQRRDELIEALMRTP
jgi:ABC-2 type transport system permease protein